MNTRVCGNCKVEKIEDESNFQLLKYKNGTTYYHSFCKECKRLKALQYAKDHREERKEYSKNFTANNPEYKKKWKEANKDKINEQERKSCVSDINFRLKKNVSRAIGHAITKNGNSTFKYLPYTTQELKQHLEKQFDSNMSWSNYGSYWHIDHIMPRSLFQYISMEDAAFKECWALSNLRPLEAKRNMMDGSTRIRHKKR